MHIKSGASPVILACVLIGLFLLLISPIKCGKDMRSREKSHININMTGDDYVAIVRTKTDPRFYISLHREKDDVPRAPIRYTGLYYEKQRTFQMHAFMNMSDHRMDGIFLDIGANIGWFSLYAAAMGRNVIAFEPSPMNVLRLRQGIQANNFENVIVKPFGAGPQDALLHFRSTAGSFGGGAFVLGWNASKHDAAITELRIKRVTDELKNVPRRWKQRVAIVKIDVEGFEAGAIEGMMDTLRKDLPVVFLEFWHRPPKSGHYYEVVMSFLELGYRPHPPHESLPTSLDGITSWFANNIHSSRVPVDMLFIPAWMADGNLPCK